MDKEQAIEIIETHSDDISSSSLLGRALNMAIEALKAQLSQQGTTKDVISRQAAIDALQNCHKHCIDPFDSYHIDIQDAENQLSKVPTVQPEPKEGEWLQIQRCTGDAQPDLECPFCKHRIGWWDMGRYCAGCGAKLEGGAE